MGSILEDRMFSHREVFGMYATEANKGEKDYFGKNAYSFRSWLADSDLRQCDYCKKYGAWGHWVRPASSDSDSLVCLDCLEQAYGFYGEQEVYVEVSAPKGWEAVFLLNELKSLGETDPRIEFLRWGVMINGQYDNGRDRQLPMEARCFVGHEKELKKEGWMAFLPGDNKPWEWAEWDDRAAGEIAIFHRGKTVTRKVRYDQRVILRRDS